MTTRATKVTVVGSINMDLVVRCDKLPSPGQTVLASSSAEVCGGKGANQAVAAARAGGHVSVIGRVGDDAFAQRLVNNLDSASINCRAIEATSACASGLAVVAVEESGQNSIMVVPGANGRVSVGDVHRHRQWIAESDVVLLQLEIPIDAVMAAIEIARDSGVRVILDPAPAPRQWPEELLGVDLLCPNESEAAALVGHDVETIEQAESAARELHQRGAGNVAITLGGSGTLLFDGQSAQLINSYPVTVVDTTAAGDAFAGALAVRWGEQDDLAKAVQFANAAGALAASREGAQPGMGSRDEIENLWGSKT